MIKELHGALPISLAAIAVLAVLHVASAQMSMAARPLSKPIVAPQIDHLSAAEGLAVAGGGADVDRGENSRSSLAT